MMPTERLKRACVKPPRLNALVAPCWLSEKQHPFKAKTDCWIFYENDANCVIISLLPRDFLSQQRLSAAVQTVSISEALMESSICMGSPAGCQLSATVTPVKSLSHQARGRATPAPSANITWEAESDQPLPFSPGHLQRPPEQTQPAIHVSGGGALSVNISKTTLLLAGLVWQLPYELRRMFIQPYGELLVLISRTLTTCKSPCGHSCTPAATGRGNTSLFLCFSVFHPFPFYLEVKFFQQL